MQDAIAISMDKNGLEGIRVQEVIDLESYEFCHCFCNFENFATPIVCVVIALLAIPKHLLDESLSADSFALLDAIIHAACEVHRHYQRA